MEGDDVMLVDELLTYPEGDRRRAWEFYLGNGGDGIKSPDWYDFMDRWRAEGDGRLMILIRRGRYYEVDPIDPEASRARLDQIRRENDEYFAQGRRR